MPGNVNILTYLAEPGVLGVLVISVGQILRNIRKHVRFTYSHLSFMDFIFSNMHYAFT